MEKKNPYKAKLINFKYILFDIFRWCGLPLLLWFRIKKIFVSKDQKKHIKGGALVISNHILYSDVMVLHCTFWYRRLQFLVMEEIMQKGFTKWFYKNCGCVPINRDKPSLKSFRSIVQRLEGGNLVAMFPEGHVSFSNDNPMAPFKSGAVLMAYQANVPIVPTYREIRSNIWKRQRIVIGEPIDLRKTFGENMGLKEIEQATQYLFEKEQELKNIYHGGK